MRFTTVDADRKPEVEVIDGIPTICTDRTVLVEHGEIEPTDDRIDTFVSIPMRSVHTSTGGICFEIGPFTLDAGEIAKLQNALADHINSSPDEFRWRK
ncbi:MAG: hypothetical protein LLG14_20415 [Nocardiaceae bacterium]|nr:hypothetical protein [Nocardiaceae bacterium]